MEKRELSDSEKELVWKKYYGDAKEAIDVYGDKVTKQNCQYDHILPYSIVNETRLENMMPISKEANAEKNDNIKWTYKNVRYEVKENSSNPKIGDLYKIDLFGNRKKLN